jgi:hypothetical protein
MNPELSCSGTFKIALVTRERFDLLVNGIDVRKEISTLTKVPLALYREK